MCAMVLKYAEEMWVGKIGWLQILTSENDCEYSMYLIVPLKEHIGTTNFFGNEHTTDARITQRVEECKFSCKSKSSTFKEWMTAIPSVANVLFQQIHYFRGWKNGRN